MPKPPPDAWVDEQGNIITIADCIDALNTAASIILREIKHNTGLINSLAMEEEYERKSFIIGKIKDSYEMAVLRQKRPTGIPSKKRRSH